MSDVKKLNVHISKKIWEPHQDWVDAMGVRRCVENTLEFVNYLDEQTKESSVISKIRAALAFKDYKRVVELIKQIDTENK